MSLVPTPLRGFGTTGPPPPKAREQRKLGMLTVAWYPPSGVKPQELHKMQKPITPHNTRRVESVLLISRDLPKTAWISVKSLSFSKDLHKPPGHAGRRKTTISGVCEREPPA